MTLPSLTVTKMGNPSRATPTKYVVPIEVVYSVTLFKLKQTSDPAVLGHVLPGTV